MAMLSIVATADASDARAIAASLEDPYAFEAIFDRHFTAIHRFLRARVGPELAEELASETFVQAFSSRRGYAGEVTDELGRHGSAIELTEPDERRRLVFDPTTSQVLDEQDVLTRRVAYLDADPGYVTGYRLVLEQGIVDGDTVRP
ncbi:MAG TPA: hypothetical protein VGF63_02740 [Solirubrobacteraceae bacterium]